MRKNLSRRLPISERVWGNAQILCRIRDFHEVI